MTAPHSFAAQRRRQVLTALAFIAPVLIFLLVFFVLPLGQLMLKSVANPEVISALPRTTAELKDYQATQLPADHVWLTLAQELPQAAQNNTLGNAARRLNIEVPGYRSLLTKTARALTEPELPPLSEQNARTTLVAIDARWEQAIFWTALYQNRHAWTASYLLAAVDHETNAAGNIVAVSEERSLYLQVFARTFWISLCVTLICLLLAYPLAYWLASLPTRQANLLMILVLLPFWTSILVRIAAWIVLLQSGGLVNSALIYLGIIEQPLALVFNRTGVMISMVHILLPFMVLPIFSVMKSISPTYRRAAISLGAHPFIAFWRVYFPLTRAGVGAGCILVFVLSLGYYITPALLGAANDQLLSYFVAFYTNGTINWGMATALGGLLLIASLALYAVYTKLVGSENMRLG